MLRSRASIASCATSTSRRWPYTRRPINVIMRNSISDRTHARRIRACYTAMQCGLIIPDPPQCNRGFLRTGTVILCLLAVSGLQVVGQPVQVPEQLTFSEALEIAETNNPTFRAVTSLLELARADRREAGAPPNPFLEVEGEEYAGFANNPPSFWDGQALIVRLEQELEVGGQRGHRRRVADAAITVARYQVADARRTLLATVGHAYLGLALAQADQSLARDALRNIEQIIQVTEVRYNLGEVAGTDLRRLQIERLHFVEELFRTDLAIGDARIALLQVLGAADPGQMVAAIDSLDTPPMVDPTGRLIASTQGVAVELDSLHAIALERRPDFLGVRHERARAAAAVRLQRARTIPNLTVGWGYRRSFGDHAMDFAIGVPLPLFGLNPGGVQRAEAELRRVESMEAAAQSIVRSDVERANRAVIISAERVSSIEEKYEGDVTELLGLVRASWEIGESSLLTLLDAEREYLATRKVRNEILHALRSSMVDLATAVGIPPR